MAATTAEAEAVPELTSSLPTEIVSKLLQSPLAAETIVATSELSVLKSKIPANNFIPLALAAVRTVATWLQSVP